MICLALALVLAPQSFDTIVDDPRLKTPIDIRIEAESVPALCKALAASTGVSLSADEMLKDDLVVLFAKRRPAVEVMRRVAEHFSWTWERQDGGYRLVPSDEFRESARTAVRDHALASVEQVRRQARDAADAWDRIDTSEATNELIAAFRQEEELEGAWPPDPKLLLDSVRTTMDRIMRADPIQGFVNHLLAQISDSAAIEMADGRAVFSTNPKGAQRPFPPAVLARVPRLLDQMRVQEAVLGAALSPSERHAVGRRFFSPRPDLAKTVDTRVSLGRYGIADVFFLKGDGTAAAWGRAYAGGPPTSAKEPSKAESRGAVTEAIDEPRLRATVAVKPPSDGTEIERIIAALNLGKEPLSEQGKLLVEVAESCDVCFVGDCYGPRSDKWILGSQSAAAAFDKYCKVTNAQWRWKDGWVSIRTAEWPYARLCHIPGRSLADVFRTYRRQEGLTVDQQADWIYSLTPQQCESRFLRCLPYELYGETIEMLRFWGSLPRSFRSRLRAGARIAFTEMPVPARRALSHYLLKLGELTVPTGGCGAFSASSFCEPEFLDDEDEAPEVGLPIDSEITEVFANGWGSDPIVQVRFAAMPGLATKDDFSRTLQFYCPQSVAAILDPQTGLPKGSIDGDGPFRLATEDAYEFRFNVSPNCRYVSRCCGLTVGQTVPPDIKALPTSLQRRIRAHWKEDE